MASRWFFPRLGAADVSPAYDAAWGDIADGDRLKMVQTRINSTPVSDAAVASAAPSLRVLIRQYVGDALAAQTIAGTVKGQVRCVDSNGLDNVEYVSVSIRVVSNDGTVVRGTLLALGEYVASNVWSVGDLTNRKIADGDALSSLAIEDGDRLVVELGYKTISGGTDDSRGSMSFGDDSATDLPEDETEIAANNSWIEFSQDILFQVSFVYSERAQTEDTALLGTPTAGTSAFQDAWGSAFAQRVVMFKLDLALPSGLTIRGSMSGLFDPDGNYWQELIEQASPIREPGGWLSPGPNLAECSLTLSDREISETPGKTFSSLLYSYYVQGAAITIYWWERSLVSSADLFQRFVGVVAEYSVDPVAGTVTLQILQDRKWNVELPPDEFKVTRTAYPKAPEQSLGGYKAILIGDWRSIGLRPPFTSAYLADKARHEDLGSNEPKVPGIVVDRGAGVDPVKVLAAGHQVSQINTIFGCRAGIQGGQLLSNIDTATVSTINTSTEAGISISEEVMLAWAPVVPVDVRVVGANVNTALDPKNAIDYLDEQSFATVDFSAGQGRLQLIIPSLSPLGQVIEVYSIILYRTLNASGDCSLITYELAPPTNLVTINVPASTTATSVSALSGFGQWDLGNPQQGPYSGKTIDILVTGPAGQKLYVYGVGLAVKYKPALALVQRNPPRGTEVLRNYLWGSRFPLPAHLYELRTPVSFSAVGPNDEADGRWTGVNADPIERPTDVIRYLLSRWGGEDRDIDFNLDTDSLGSFVDARTAMRTMEGEKISCSLFINSAQKMRDAIRLLAEECLSEVEKDPQTGIWMVMPWTRQPAQNYRTLYRNDLEALEFHQSGDTEIAQAVRIGYAHSPATGKHLFEAHVSPDGSEQGYLADTFGDQRLEVVAGNQTLKFSPDGATTKTATFTPGVYSTAIGLAVEIQTQMRVGAATSNWFAGHGSAIKTGFNDQIHFTIAGTPYSVTLTEYDYTPDNLAREATQKMNAAQAARIFAVTYNRATSKFKVAANGSFTLNAENTTRAALAVLGFTMGTAIADVSSPFEQEGAVLNMEHLWIAHTGAAGKLYMSSAVVAGTTCQTLLGWTNTVDPTVGRSQATRRRGTRQSQAAESVTRWGERDTINRRALTIRSSTSAADLRDRLFDFLKAPPPFIRGISRKIADIRRGNVLALDSETIDSWCPFAVPGSNGSHAGRFYRVTELTAHQGPQDFSTHFDAYLMDAPALPASTQALGAGSSFISWTDLRGSNDQTFAQKLDQNGARLWTADGVQVSNSTGVTAGILSSICSDGQGGCFIAYMVRTGARWDIYCQRLAPDGTIATGGSWVSGGVVICNDAGGDHRSPKIIPDGFGGAIAAWLDARHAANLQTYAQRVSATGAVAWAANGVRLFTDTTHSCGGSNLNLFLCSDGSAGAFLCFSAFNGTTNRKVVAQRVASDGTIPAGWSTTGVSLGNSAGSFVETAYGVVLDGSTGAIFVYDHLGAVKAQGLTAAGAIGAGWPVSPGLTLSTGSTNVGEEVAVSDGAGGVIVAWLDVRSSNDAVYAQRVSGAGAVQWTAGGVLLNTAAAAASTVDSYLAAAADGSGGAVLGWLRDTTITDYDVYAQRVSSGGSPLWGAGALIIRSTGGNGTATVVAASDGASGGIFCWKDVRAVNSDIYAQRVNSTGAAQWITNGVGVCTQTDNQETPAITSP